MWHVRMTAAGKLLLEDTAKLCKISVSYAIRAMLRRQRRGLSPPVVPEEFLKRYCDGDLTECIPVKSMEPELAKLVPAPEMRRIFAAWCICELEKIAATPERVFPDAGGGAYTIEDGDDGNDA